MVNDLLRKEQFKCFKLMSAEYDEKNDLTTITFLYSSFNKPAEEKKEELKSEILKSLGDFTKTKIKFKQSYIDSDIVFAKFDEFTHSFPYLKGCFKLEDIHTQMTADEVKIEIDCDKETKDLLLNYNFISDFKKLVESELYEKVLIKLNSVKEEKTYLNIDEENSKIELNNIIEQEKQLNKVEVDEIVNVVGKNIFGKAVFIKDINKAEEIIIAGQLLNPVWSEFVPRNKKASGDGTLKSKFSFTLKDASGEIDVVMFPNKSDEEKLKNLAEGCEVIICGAYNDFMGRINIKANALSVCKIKTKEVKYIWREPEKDYKTIIPEKMVDLQQMNLFSMFDTKPNEYWKDGKSVVVFDFETTGLNPENCEIIEIGAVKIENGVCTQTFSTLINPHQKLDLEISNLTGITDDMLVFAPDLEDVLPDFHKFCQGAVLSAYNIGFDIQFLLKAGKKFRYKFDNERIDTLDLARKKIPSLPNYKLSSVVKALDIVLNDAHRAINDAVATAKVFIKLI